jgi:hypothetical protein
MNLRSLLKPCLPALFLWTIIPISGHSQCNNYSATEFNVKLLTSTRSEQLDSMIVVYHDIIIPNKNGDDISFHTNHSYRIQCTSQSILNASEQATLFMQTGLFQFAKPVQLIGYWDPKPRKLTVQEEWERNSPVQLQYETPPQPPPTAKRPHGSIN